MNDYYSSLNTVIDEIENNLTNKIDYKKLARLVGTSDYTLQRIFCFLTGITLTEYIRKRRLTRAAEDLQKENCKIIDIALRYQYDSPISFTRAFTKMHNISPSKVRETKTPLKLFPKIEFVKVKNVTDEIEYKILDIDEQTFYGKCIKKIDTKNKQAISNLYDELRKNGTLDYIIQNAKSDKLYYGASVYKFADEYRRNSDVFDYYIMGAENRKDFQKLVIPKARWAIFKLKSKKQEDIIELINTIYTKWLPSSKFNLISKYPDLEIYYEDYCEYCIAVE